MHEKIERITAWDYASMAFGKVFVGLGIGVVFYDLLNGYEWWLIILGLIMTFPVTYKLYIKK